MIHNPNNYLKKKKVFIHYLLFHIKIFLNILIIQLINLLFEYSSFGSLKNYLIENFILNEKYFLLILKQINEGLHLLHKGFRNENQFKRSSIAHRDFKSENILFLILIILFFMILLCQLKFININKWFLSKTTSISSFFRIKGFI